MQAVRYLSETIQRVLMGCCLPLKEAFSNKAPTPEIEYKVRCLAYMAERQDRQIQLFLKERRRNRQAKVDPAFLKELLVRANAARAMKKLLSTMDSGRAQLEHVHQLRSLNEIIQSYNMVGSSTLKKLESEVNTFLRVQDDQYILETDAEQVMTEFSQPIASMEMDPDQLMQALDELYPDDAPLPPPADPLPVFPKVPDEPIRLQRPIRPEEWVKKPSQAAAQMMMSY